MRTPEEELAALDAQCLRRSLRYLDSPQQPQTILGGRPLVNFSSNDYLGLANHPQLKRQLQEAVAQYGAGSGASRLVCGGSAPHRRLEGALAEAKGTQTAISFSSGYAAALGTLTAILRKGDVVILDKLSHASLIDGARLSGATIRVFPHNNLAKLASLLEWAVAEVGLDGRIVVVTEEVFSMDGDVAPIPEIATLARKHGAWLLVDSAHAFGLLPRAVALPSEEKIIHLGTLSKAVGLSGGFIATTQVMADLVVNSARSFIYSTAPPPALAAAAGWVVEHYLPSHEAKAAREHLWALLHLFSEEMGLPAPQSAIVPFILGEAETAMTASRELLHAGFLVPAIRYPTVAKDAARLRITFTASHSETQVLALVAALRALPCQAVPLKATNGTK